MTKKKLERKTKKKMIVKNRRAERNFKLRQRVPEEDIS